MFWTGLITGSILGTLIGAILIWVFGKIRTAWTIDPTTITYNCVTQQLSIPVSDSASLHRIYAKVWDTMEGFDPSTHTLPPEDNNAIAFDYDNTDPFVISDACFPQAVANQVGICLWVATYTRIRPADRSC